MIFNDWLWRGPYSSTDSVEDFLNDKANVLKHEGRWWHFNRRNDKLLSEYRNPYRMAIKIPVMMRRGWRFAPPYVVQFQYASYLGLDDTLLGGFAVDGPLGCPAGCKQMNGMAGGKTGDATEAKEFGWGPTKHSDIVNLPYYDIRKWFLEHIIKKGLK